MFLRFDVSHDELMLTVQTGPKEKYDPNEQKEVVELFEKIRDLDKEIKEMRSKINPRLESIKTAVKEYNSKQVDKKMSED